VAATLFLFLSSSSPVWYLSSLLAIAANVGFGVSIVAMNAYLPMLAQESPDVASLRHDLENYDAVTDREDDDTVTENPAAPLLSASEHRKDLESHYQTVLARETSRISSLGVALGYGSGIVLLALTLLPVNRLHGSTFALRLAIGLSGIWWFVFSIPAAVLLPSAPASAREVDEYGQKEWSFTREILGAWIGLVNLLRWREIRRLRNTFKFLAAWFLLSDGEYTSDFPPMCPLTVIS
jgi:UMF1 family MFS transporter